VAMVKKSKRLITNTRYNMKYVIRKLTSGSYCGKVGWTIRPFARRFDSYSVAVQFLIDCKMIGVEIEILN
jgi:hypothetical protein